MAMKRWEQLRHIFDSQQIGPHLKLRLYIVAVDSLVTYGFESWQLTPQVMCKLNGANSQMLSRVTGRNVRDEVRESTTSFDILRHIRKIRLKWLGDILRSDTDRMIYQCIHLQMHLNNPGSILMDAPHSRVCMSYEYSPQTQHFGTNT